MPAASKVKDIGHVPSDSHGNICCSHSCSGPAISGSRNTYVNGQQVLRIGDPGVHSSCCGANTFVTAEGSTTVTVNDIPVCRLGDTTTHCGGTGSLVTGSYNVYIGG